MLRPSSRTQLDQPLTCSGLPWLRWSTGPKQRNFPLQALSWNHRRAALYNCWEQDPQHPMVQMALKQGLQRCRVLHKNTPSYVIEWLVAEHNKHHRGSGLTVMSVVHDALKAEAAWHKHCSDKGITTKMPHYQRQYDSYIRTHFSTFQESINAFQDAKALGRALSQYDMLGDFEDPFPLLICMR